MTSADGVEPALPPASRDYHVTGGYDEAFEAPGRVREAYADLLGRLTAIDLHHLTEELNGRLVERGLVFGGESAHPFRVDPVPRLLTGAEWTGLSAGLAQRVRALDAYVDDVYGDRRAVAEGVVPADVVESSSYLEPDLVGRHPEAGAWISVAGLDLVRGADGTFVVLEDNVRTPSGITYALAATDALAELGPVEVPVHALREGLVAGLRRVMEAAAPEVAGELVLVSEGEANSAWYEHRRLAEEVGLTVVAPDRLRRVGDHVELDDGRRVRTVYRRTDGDRVRDPDGSLSPLAALMLEPLRTGTVGMVNRFGTGVADDKALYAYVGDLIAFYLGEEPLLASVPTFDLSRPDQLAEVSDRLAELVVKPRDGMGGQGVVVGSTASPQELAEARTTIRAHPTAWIAQEIVPLSTHPTVVDGVLEPRHVDLRPFVFYDGAEATVPPGGLTRVALQAGSMVVNSSRDGGGKPTWVVGP